MQGRRIIIATRMVVARTPLVFQSAIEQSTAAGSSAIATLDPQALDRLRALDPAGTAKLLSRVVEAYLASANRLRRQLHDGLAAGDSSAVRLAAHTLKSSSASVGALGLADACARAEALARDHATGAPLEAAVQELCRELEAAIAALHRLPESPPR